MKFQILLLLVGLASQALAAPTSDTSILQKLQTKKTATVIVSVTGSDVTGLQRGFEIQTFASRDDRLNSYYNLLKNYADTTQANILSFLNEVEKEKPIVVVQLWVTNEIIVQNVDLETVQQLLELPEVDDVREERVFTLEEPIDLIVHPDGTVPHAGEQWGVVDIDAPQVHSSGNRGAGAVIGTIDTGVRGTHAALKAGLRSTYNWYDPYSRTASPNDQNGHGTHTMGTIAGRANGIGVAPAATWISCKGCDSSGCTESALKTCGQFMTCPTNTAGSSADCTKAPNAVSNSWGGGQGDTWYDQIIAGWSAVQIAPLFSIGNSGPTCGSANSPGDSTGAIGVGSTTQAGGLSSFSSVGPTYRGNRIKPDIAAPGSAVVSSYYLSDTSYSTLSGTSMACPHVGGLAALLYTARPNLTVPQLKAALLTGAQRVTSSGRNCGGISEGTYPNHHVGQGRINAVASLNYVMSL